jgi:hypothetical protein
MLDSFLFDGSLLDGVAPPPAARTDLKQAITAVLKADGPTAGLVGQNLFPVVIPQTATPGTPTLTYKFVSSLHGTNVRQASGMRSTRVRFRISSFAHGDIESGLEILRNLFQGLIGPLSGLPICFVTLENEVDDYSEPLPGSDLGTHSKEFDFVFKFRESIPTNT